MALNTADLGYLATLLAGILTGPAAAFSKGAGWLSPVYVIPGFIIAWIAGPFFNWLAYRGLAARIEKPDALAGCLWGVSPLASIVAVIVATAWLCTTLAEYLH
jgi:hypothetical protein